MRRTLMGILAGALLSGLLVPGALRAAPPKPGYVAPSTSLQHVEAAPPSVDRAGSSDLLMLVGFLGLIAALLTHWSRDTSCREERSVYRSDEAA